MFMSLCKLMSVLVTGCLGFIGSHLTEKLLSSNYNVIGIDNIDPYYNPNYKYKNLEILKKNKNFIFIHGDFTNQKLLELLFINNEIDKVFHIGAKAGVRPSVLLPVEYARNNILSTVILLELCRKYDIKDFYFASSSSVYGNSKEIPFKEEVITSTPESPYATTKRSCELFGYTFHSLYKINFIAYRFFTVYGPRGRPDMAVYKFTKKIINDEEISVYGDGNFSRDFTYISDIINGIYLGMDKKMGYQIFNLGNEQPIKVLSLIQILEEIIGKKAKIKYVKPQKGDVKNTFADISKARKLLGYKPEVDIRTGLKKFVDWYRSEHS